MIDMTQFTIFDGNIDNDLWPEILLAMTQVKNIKPTTSFEDKNPYKVHFNKALKLSHLQVYGSIVYIFIHKKEQNLKSEKFEAWTLQKIPIGYNKRIIYWVFIQLQDKVIHVKDFRIFEAMGKKNSTFLPDFKG